MPRVNMVILLAGKRGTGKTTLIKKEVLAHSRLKCLVVDTFDSPVWRELPALNDTALTRWKAGNYRYFNSDTKHVMSMIEKHVYNTTIIFEDATKYVGSKLTDDVRKFVLDSKQKNLDLVFIFHSLTSIPSELVRIADALTLLKVGDKPNSTTVRSKYEEPVLEALDKVRKSKDPYVNITLRLN
jgi:molybdopterin-guanine dinucleotide biosynthesis protein